MPRGHFPRKGSSDKASSKKVLEEEEVTEEEFVVQTDKEIEESCAQAVFGGQVSEEDLNDVPSDFDIGMGSSAPGVDLSAITGSITELKDTLLKENKKVFKELTELGKAFSELHARMTVMEASLEAAAHSHTGQTESAPVAPTPAAATSQPPAPKKDKKAETILHGYNEMLSAYKKNGKTFPGINDITVAQLNNYLKKFSVSTTKEELMILVK